MTSDPLEDLSDDDLGYVPKRDGIAARAGVAAEFPYLQTLNAEQREAVETAAPDLLITDWRDMNQALFKALSWQTRILFLVQSLVVMVAAFMGPAWRQAYELALSRGYRFLSFGDAMLAERR